MYWKTILDSINTVLKESNLPTFNIIVDMDGYLVKPEILPKNLHMFMPFVPKSDIDQLYLYICDRTHFTSSVDINSKIKINRIVSKLTKSIPNKIDY